MADDSNVAAHLASDLGAPWVVGTNLFTGPVRIAVGGIPHQAIFCLLTSGAPGDGSAAEFKRPRVNVRVRSNPGDFGPGLALALAVQASLFKAPASNAYVRSRVLQQEPIYKGQDEQDHHEWETSIDLWVPRWTALPGGSNPSPFAAEIERIATLIAALTPGVSASNTFFRMSNNSGTYYAIRQFEVMADPGLRTDRPYMAPRTRQATRQIVVEVLYDGQGATTSLETLIAADDDQIVTAVELPPFSTNVQITTCASGSTVKEGDFWRRRITFDCTYTYTF